MYNYVLFLALWLVGCASMDKRFAEVDRLHNIELVRATDPYIADEFIKDENRVKVAAIVCGKKTTDQDCHRKMFETFTARLSDRYKFTNPDYTNRKCEAYPVECSDPKKYETWVRESHNANLEESRKARYEQVKQMQQNESAYEAQQYGKLGEQLTNWGNSMKPTPTTTTNCTTTRGLSGSFSTTCN